MSTERVDLPGLYDPNGRYGRGLAVPAVVYYPWASRQRVAPEETVRMPGVKTRSGRANKDRASLTLE